MSNNVLEIEWEYVVNYGKSQDEEQYGDKEFC